MRSKTAAQARKKPHETIALRPSSSPPRERDASARFIAELRTALHDPLLPLIAIALRESDCNFRHAATLLADKAIRTLRRVERLVPSLAEPAPTSLFIHPHTLDLTVGDLYSWHFGLHKLYQTRRHVKLSEARAMLKAEFRCPKID